MLSHVCPIKLCIAKQFPLESKVGVSAAACVLYITLALKWDTVNVAGPPVKASVPTWKTNHQASQYCETYACIR